MRLGLCVALMLMSACVALADPRWHRSVSVEYAVATDGNTVGTETWEVRADTESVAHTIAQQTFSAAADLEQVELLEAYTQKADGSRIPVRPGSVLPEAVTTLAAAPQFSALAAQTIVFPGVAAGDTVHYTLRRRSTATVFPGVFTMSLQAGNWSTTERAEISITTPPGLALQGAARGLDAAPPQPTASGGTVWRWARAVAPSGAMSLDLSSFADYAALGRAYGALAWPQSAPSPSVQAVADRLSAGAADQREVAQRLYRYVAGEVRYVAKFLGNGRVEPRAAEVVLLEGWGDCKDHAALLQAMLAAEGIAAQPALMTLRDRYRLEQAPGLGVLDHVITYIPAFDLYVDSTDPYAPFGTLLASEYDKPVILADPVAARLGRTPAMAPGTMVLSTRTEARIDDQGGVSGTTTTQASGPQSVALRSMAAWFEGRGTSYSARAQLEQAGTPGVGRYRFDPPELVRDEYQVTGDFTLDEPLPDGGAAPFHIPAGLGVFGQPGRLLLNAVATEGGSHICYPGRESEEIALVLPPGARLRSLPPDVDVIEGGGRYSAHYRVEDGALQVRREFAVETATQICDAAAFAAMQTVLAAARHDQAGQISLRHDSPARIARGD